MAAALVVRVMISVMSGLSAMYVANTFLYLSPPNPLTLKLWPLIRTIQEPFFVQNWHLFAPNPVRTNLVLTVRCRIGDKVTPWRDPMTPLLARHHRSRLSPMGKMIRIPQNAMHLVLGRTSDEWRSLICRRSKDHPTCRGEDQASRRARELGQFLLHRIASGVCDGVAEYGRVTSVQTRILIHEPPVWSMRDMPAEAGSTKYITLPWMPYMPRGSSEDDRRRSL